MAHVETISIATNDDHPVIADVYPPATGGRAVVILCHGFKGHRRWGFFPFLAERLRDAGMWALSIDFSHNGTVRSDGSIEPIYIEPDLFEANTLRREFEDLGRVIEFVRSGGVDGLARGARIGLMGHSRGCVATVLHAVDDKAIDAVVTWSAADDPDFFTPRQKQLWREQGRLEFTEACDGARLALGIDYLDDLEQNHDFYLLRDRVRELAAPHLLVHGELDMAVAPAGSQALFAAANKVAAKKLVGLKTGHTFGLPYPSPAALDKIPRALVRAADETVDWFSRYLSEGHAR